LIQLQNAEKALCRLLKKDLRGEARRSMSEAYLPYVAEEAIERNEAYGSFGAAC
jgi:hypothetical protein